MSTVTAELVASVLSVSVTPGQRVEVGDELLLLDSMKMEIPVLAEVAGVVTDVVIKAGDTVRDGDPLVVIKR
ncbi:biotin/lipoyl-binding carrier protein [Propioniciclava tarda]|uniref:Biotin/lipoyl-binding carrier protein n=1 Tax=Propioniciclava tarda TaxID=433330 RepID=A0A4V2JSZ9_PROTD|nr:biotin/lipoyl-binding carrier protein [Propioniciclava tarda]TBT94311.1 biotin/lipoyl-binding carrier protein [Propioniciclava tarda]SMO73991.1 Biotin-requiring enzyme [Propioniciclava tarda]HOA90076.1 biotin/lipoyl-binding carrier protein [Propioniciclava tarda]HQA31330.1 biotin/lipoyl-binding carrier protein [Propioniciclava tarda]HQD61105.1 biotin/lipoyl-binding carrier protein [Propioniciclava tarda]